MGDAVRAVVIGTRQWNLSRLSDLENQIRNLEDRLVERMAEAETMRAEIREYDDWLLRNGGRVQEIAEVVAA